ncbi:MAG: UDP-N-acetylmuramoyl-L-alanyl-D-glutamate--2,6-diaminopimelate ligase [Ruminococcaceae bacterium]|nr:UDP-N-acetylmuramoyl-L-alanyl-D-glutamate--2,6-diaminopimelate ligase [Oscillospiraceae bacterium]
MSHTHLSARQLLAALPCRPRTVTGNGAAADVALRALCCDSRRAGEGSLFVCIRGALSDGHRYILSAYETGCRCFLVEQLPDAPLPPDAYVFLSDNTRRDLAHLAAAFYGYPAREMTIVGITGTKGKTTTAMLCHHIATKAGIPSGYIGTCGVRYGEVNKKTNNTTPGPLELQQYLFEMKQAGVQAVFLEVSSQAVWQYRVEGIPFTAVAMTNLTPDHIGTHEHPDFDHYMACKRRLLTDFGAPVVLLNADDSLVDRMGDALTATVLRCGIRHAADLRAADLCHHTQNGLPGIAFIYQNADGNTPVFLPLPGEHNVFNALFALAITGTLGIKTEAAVAALADASIPGRFEMIRAKDALVVIDYAHNGAALRAALNTLRTYAPRRLLCLVGSVGERTQCRRAELGSAASDLADFTYLTADDPGLENAVDICREMAAAFADDSRYRIIPDRAEAICAALDELCAGDILLLAGKGDEQVQKIGGKSLPHSDRAVVEAYAAAISTPV